MLMWRFCSSAWCLALPSPRGVPWALQPVCALRGAVQPKEFLPTFRNLGLLGPPLSLCCLWGQHLTVGLLQSSGLAAPEPLPGAGMAQCLRVVPERVCSLC